MNLSAVCLVLVSVTAVNVEAQVKKHVVLRNAEMEGGNRSLRDMT